MVKRNVWPVAVVLLTCSLAACGSTTSPPPGNSTSTQVAPTTSNADALCAALRQLGSDVHDLVTLDVVAVGVNGVNAALQQVYAQLQVVAQQAGSTFGPQLQAMRAELDDLGNTIAGLTDATSIRARLSELRSELSAVAAGWDALKRQAADVCP
jgi:hypothetical protein